MSLDLCLELFSGGRSTIQQQQHGQSLRYVQQASHSSRTLSTSHIGLKVPMAVNGKGSKWAENALCTLVVCDLISLQLTHLFNHYGLPPIGHAFPKTIGAPELRVRVKGLYATELVQAVTT